MPLASESRETVPFPTGPPKPLPPPETVPAYSPPATLPFSVGAENDVSVTVLINPAETIEVIDAARSAAKDMWCIFVMSPPKSCLNDGNACVARTTCSNLPEVPQPFNRFDGGRETNNGRQSRRRFARQNS